MINTGREGTLKRVQRRACGLFRAGVDQVSNRFGLGQVQLVVEKRALGKLAGTGDAQAGQGQDAL